MKTGDVLRGKMLVQKRRLGDEREVLICRQTLIAQKKNCKKW
jgi:hypothetical protein